MLWQIGLAKRRGAWYSNTMELPQEFCTRMKSLLGEDYRAFAQSYDLPAQIGLRRNTLVTAEQLHEWLGLELQPIAYEPTGYYSVGECSGNHCLHQAGAFYRQDPSAMLTAAAIDWRGDEWVLDMCAAPGGKSTQIAAKLPRGWLVANEIETARAKVLLGNIERMGIDNATVLSTTPQRVAQAYGAVFDVVVVDAPCSGEGMFRKNPNAIAEWSLDNVRMCAARQKQILDCAMRCVKPNGKLIYSTCTFAPEEDEGAVAYLLDNGMRLLDATPAVRQATQGGIDMPQARRFYPHLGRGEGHFVAVLQQTNVYPAVKPQKQAVPIGRDAQAVSEWLDKNMQGKLPIMPLLSGVQKDKTTPPYVFGAPINAPAPPSGFWCHGVRLGQLAGGRLDPHHMAFKCLASHMKSRLDLLPDDPRVAAYLHGETLQADIDSGFGVLTVLGVPLGGYKAVEGIIKNRYPKGLRL